MSRASSPGVLGGYQEVGASRTDEAWVVRTGRPLLLWNGRTWRSQGGAEAPYLVRGHGPEEVWRFNESVEQVTVWRWNGRRWSSLPIPEPGAHATAAVVPAKGECWAAGLRFGAQGMRDVVWHHAGGRWRTVAAPAPLTDFAAVSSSAVWALSSYEGGPSASILRWDGRQWAPEHLPPLEFAELADIVALAEDDVWAVGAIVVRRDGVRSLREALVLHWDGTAWRRVQHRPAATGFTAAAPDGTGGLWLATESAEGPDTLTRHRRGAWESVALGLPKAQVKGLANVPGSTRMWATVDADGEQVILSYK
ncbi:hypothetical protein [Nonomuraea sp. NPDC050310]|uniref:hypothetical protein n=1 Tax=Nonomuraea sp. NPDC050310 TaxID=3154935 RepID=UPI0033C286DC